MKKTVLFAPQIDTIIEGFNPENNPMALSTYLKLKDIYNVFSCVKSGNDDEIRHTWIEVELRQNPKAYNSYIQENLSWTKRFGRIKRKDYWDILGDSTIRTDKNLGEETIKKLKTFVEAMKKRSTPLLQEMTANMFFRIHVWRVQVL